MTTVFVSKIDPWLASVLGVAVAASVWAGFQLLQAGLWPAALLTAGVGAGLPAWLLLDTRYIVDATHLRVRSGPFRWRVPIADISRVTPSANPMSSPALSLDRLRIEYGLGAALLISPRDRDGFMRTIEDARRQSG